jgi:hypothetical protein
MGKELFMVEIVDSLAAKEIAELEARRYEAVLRADYDAFASLCHEELVYAHSNGQRDTLESYLEKCRAGEYVYHSIEHPVEQIKVIGDVALVVGAMKAQLTIKGSPTQLDNTSLAVWIRGVSGWKFLAYQPTTKPRPAGESKKADQ